MKFRVELNGETLLLDLEPNGSRAAYKLTGHLEQRGSASIEEVMPGVFSVLLNDKSLLVNVAPDGQPLEAWCGIHRYVISLADTRDRAADSKKAASNGPIEIRAQMPGKIIKVLAPAGSAVSAGQGVLIVEAMKMQNEVKAPRDGTVTRIHVIEGMTVAAGDPLLVVE